MSSKSGFKNKTLVYTFIGFNLVTFQSYAQNTVTTVSDCQSARSDLRSAKEKLAEACAAASLPAGCSASAISCDDTISEESFDTMGMIMEALGMPKNATGSQVSNKCPQLAGKDWYDEKNRLQKELKDAQKELAELSDDKAEIQDEYNKTSNDLQEQLAKAQEEYKQTEEDLNEEQRKMMAEFNNSQNQARENMRNLGSKLLELEGQVTQVQREKAQRLLVLTNAAARMGCMNKIAQEKAEYEKLYGIKGNNTGNYVQQANNKRKALNESFQACMENVNQERIKLNETTKNKVEMLQKQIRDTQSSLDEVQNSLNLAQSQLEEMKTSIANKKKNALQSVIDLGQRIQSQLQSAYQKLQTQLQTIAAKNTNLTQEINRIQNEIAALGVAPKNRSGKYSESELASRIGSYASMVSEAESAVSSSCSGSGGGSSAPATGGTGAGTGGTTQ